MNIQLKVDPSVAALIKSRGVTTIARLIDAMNGSVLRLQRYIVTQKLQGQVLHHRSGKLASSIRALPAHAEGGQLVAGVEGAGGPAWYGRVHEFGGTRAYVIVPKVKSVLRFEGRGGDIVFTKKVQHPPLPRRSFMQSSLNEMRAEIRNALQTAMSGGPK